MDAYPTFHDYRPTYNPRPRAVLDTADAAIEAWKRFDQEVERVYYAGRTADVTRAEYAMLNEVRRAAEFVQSLADETVRAYHAGQLTEQRWAREQLVESVVCSSPISVPVFEATK